uniref:Uncharacterized protein n=1 Tax=Rhizophora mucronata TaxID=61149 RepID=A0A2P2NSI5_RHIMU
MSKIFSLAISNWFSVRHQFNKACYLGQNKNCYHFLHWFMMHFVLMMCWLFFLSA